MKLKALLVLLAAGLFLQGCQSNNTNSKTAQASQELIPENKVSDLKKASLNGRVKRQVAFYYQSAITSGNTIKPESPSDYEKVITTYDDNGFMKEVDRKFLYDGAEKEFESTSYEYDSNGLANSILRHFGEKKITSVYQHTGPLSYNIKQCFYRSNDSMLWKQTYTLNDQYKITSIETTMYDASGKDTASGKRTPGESDYGFMHPFIDFRNVMIDLNKKKIIEKDTAGNETVTLLKFSGSPDVLVQTSYEYY